MNDKYNLNIPESQLDSSDLNSNSWFTGFCEADANFSVKLTKPQPKTLTKRSRSAQVSVRFTRAFYKPYHVRYYARDSQIFIAFP